MNTHAQFFCAGFNAMNGLIKASRAVSNATNVVAESLSTKYSALNIHTKCFYRGARTAWNCRELRITKLEVIRND